MAACPGSKLGPCSTAERRLIPLSCIADVSSRLQVEVTTQTTLCGRHWSYFTITIPHTCAQCGKKKASLRPAKNWIENSHPGDRICRLCQGKVNKNRLPAPSVRQLDPVSLEAKPEPATASSSEDRMMALFAAAECGDAKKVEQLLAQLPQGDLCYQTDYRNRTPLHLAVEHGQHEVVDVLVGRDDLDLAAKDCADFTALHLAAELGHEKIVARLIEKNPKLADEREKDERRASYNLTCLHLAAIKGHVTIVKQLLATNLELVNAANSCGKSALDLAVKYNRKEIMSMLVESVKTTHHAWEMFHCAILRGYDHIASHLLAQNPHLAAGHEGTTALQVAADTRRPVIVHQLLAAKADVGVNFQRSLLHFAAWYGFDTVAERSLLESPHSLDVTTVKHENVLHFAASNGHEKVVTRLLAAKPALALQRATDEQTVLHRAAAVSGDEKVVAQLLAHSPELLDAENLFGETALRLAVDNGNHGAAACLLAHGATGVDEAMFFSVICEAKDAASDEVLNLMLDRKSELIRFVDGNCNTILHFAFDFQAKSEALHSEELMIKCWQMSPEALYTANKNELTPFHAAVYSDNKFALELVQGKFSLDEIIEAFAKCDKQHPQLLVDRVGGWLSLTKDLVKVVLDYALSDNKTRKSKRRRDDDEDDDD